MCASRQRPRGVMLPGRTAGRARALRGDASGDVTRTPSGALVVEPDGLAGAGAAGIARALRDLPGLVVLESARPGHRSRWSYVTADPVAVVEAVGPRGRTFDPAREALARMGGMAGGSGTGRSAERAARRRGRRRDPRPGAGDAPVRGRARRLALVRPRGGGSATPGGRDRRPGRRLRRARPAPGWSRSSPDGPGGLAGRAVDGDETGSRGSTRSAVGSRGRRTTGTVTRRPARARPGTRHSRSGPASTAPPTSAACSLSRTPSPLAIYQATSRAGSRRRSRVIRGRSSSASCSVPGCTLRRFRSPRTLTFLDPPGRAIRWPRRAVPRRRCGGAGHRPDQGHAAARPDPADDARLRAELLASAKDRAENVMIVDVLRNDLGRVCGPAPCTCRRCARSRPSRSCITWCPPSPAPWRRDATRSTCSTRFPGGSITGAPKIRAMELIDRLEPVRRGPYTRHARAGSGRTGRWDRASSSGRSSPTAAGCTLHVGGGITRAQRPRGRVGGDAGEGPRPQLGAIGGVEA